MATTLPLPPPQVPLMDNSGKPTQQGFEFLDRLQSLVKQLNAVTNIFDGLTAAQSTALLVPSILVSLPAPTYQSFLSGSGNYTPTAGTVRIKVRMIAGGGGGTAAATNNGSNGADTSFGGWTAIHGAGGGAPNAFNNAAGGTGGTNGTGTLIARIAGQNGNSALSSTQGGNGGSSLFGGGGVILGSGAGGAAKANTGSGGAGGGQPTGGSGPGGAAGEYVEFTVSAPGTIAYVVGGGGNGGAAGVNAGGNGAAGAILIEEFYY